MSRRHLSTGEGGVPFGLLHTGPVVIRGVGRGVKDVLRPGRASRHRAVNSSADGAAAAVGHVVDDDADRAQTPPDDAGVAPVSEALGDAGRLAVEDEQEEHDVASRERTSDGDDGHEAPETRPPSATRSARGPSSAPGEVPPSDDGAMAAGAVDTAAPRDLPAPVAAARVARGGSGSAEASLVDGLPEAGSPEIAGGAAAPSSRSTAVEAARQGHRLRDRFSREAVGVAVLVVLAAVCAVLIAAVIVKTRDDAAAAAREAAAYTPPPLGSAATGGDASAIVVIGDETALRAASGVDASDRWPKLLEDAADAKVVTIASAGAGYATEGSGGRTFVESVADVPADAKVVAFVGGGADDQVSALSLARAATQAYSAAGARAPDAAIVAVGPVFRAAGTSASDLEELRTTLRSAARIAEVRWVDPVTARWVPDVDSTGALSAAEERTIAARLGAVIRSETD